MPISTSATAASLSRKRVSLVPREGHQKDPDPGPSRLLNTHSAGNGASVQKSGSGGVGSAPDGAENLLGDGRVHLVDDRAAGVGRALEDALLGVGQGVEA